MDLIPWRRKSRSGSEEAPQTALAEFRSELDGLFDRWTGWPFGDWPFSGGDSPERLAPAALDVSESDEEVLVRADMPGIDPKQVDIRIEGDRMTIRGERVEKKEDKGKNYVRMERRYGGFARTVPLPSTVDADKAKAEYKDGVLQIRLPRREGAKPKRIEVKT